jgi:RND family efflux transporter MFP subunit
LTACGHEESRRVEAAPSKPVAVSTATASLQQWPAIYEATGTVRATSTAAISSKVMGHVQQVHVAVGDRVRAGQPLVTLDARDLEANVRRAEAAQAEARAAGPEIESGIAAARAALELAETTFRRIDDLAQKKSVSAQELDEASARLKSARANHEMAVARRAQLQSKIAQADEAQRAAAIMRDFASINAPFAGIITAKSVEPGNLASPGVPLLMLEREDAYRLEASVEESKLGSIRTGQTVEVAADPCVTSARVSEIVPAVDPVSRSYTVKVNLPGSTCPGLRSGMFGKVRFTLGTRRLIAIPSAALIERGQLQSVFVADGGAARSRLITIGTRSGDLVEVLSGLNDGEKVVVSPPAGLSDGIRLEVKQ